MQKNYEGGNVDLRVPYIGYSSESESYTAAGISMYNALQSRMLNKRMSHGFQAGVSYTYSHATDEQSALGLFYNGNNPNNLRSGYGSADFDRTHVLNFTYGYQLAQDSSSEGSLSGQSHQWLGDSRHRRHPERPAVQHHRLLRSGGQHLLQHLRRHHQPDRAAGSRMHREDRAHRQVRRVL